ncbi:MAG: TfoX/Sxy family protein [Oscillospiraceae bacterium]|nr:TfoX/Sxy family protein [Oscillospiraceae bacterium]
MASSREYTDYILEQLSQADGISLRAMMGEYILYCQGKIVGGIYDDRLLVKPTASAARLMPDALPETPYPGAKPMLLVDNVDDREFLRELVAAIADDMPAPKKRKR